MKSKKHHVQGIYLHAVEDGPEEGEIVLFLHGFPEYWYSWKKQIAYFSEKGYKIIAPDLRGYNLSDKPEGIQEYTLDKLVLDIKALIEKLNHRKIYLVGHDWGGIIAWELSEKFPELFYKIVILNIPHPEVTTRSLKRNLIQMIKTSYIFFAQIPWLPEKILQLSNYKILSEGMKISANKNTFSSEDLHQYRQSWKMPGSLSAMLNWYRAAKYNRKYSGEKIQVPILLLWGEKQKFFLKRLSAESIEKCLYGKLQFIKDGTHWMHHEKSEEVNKLIYNFISSPDR